MVILNTCVVIRSLRTSDLSLTETVCIRQEILHRLLSAYPVIYWITRVIYSES